MRKTTLALLATAALALVASAGASRAQSALAGTVTSAEEGAMEGVLVTARKDGASLAVTVVTDAQGTTAFPAAKLEPGRYTLRIRAVGYDVDGKPTADVAAADRRHHRPQAQEDAQRRLPAHQRRVDRERAGTVVQKDALFTASAAHARGDREIDARRR